MSTETKDRLALRMKPETKRKIEQWYEADNCRSKNEFIEKAVNFYADYLAVNDNGILPAAISSAIDGRIGAFENRMASLLYKQSVEIDMTNGIIARQYEIGEDAMRRMRAQSVKNVKETNGRISFEQRMRNAGEE